MTEHSLTVQVVGHQSRLTMANALAETVEADRLWIDEGYHGEWKNHLRAWRAARDSGSTHALVLQDDAMPVKELRNHVMEAIEHRPEDMMSLYVGTHRPRKQEVIDAVEKADRRKASWLYADTLLWGVAVVLPTNQIDGMLETVRKIRLPYDQRLGRWVELCERRVYYPWPSLVDHADIRTVAHAEKNQGVRVAHRVGVPDWNDVEEEIFPPDSIQALASKRDIV